MKKHAIIILILGLITLTQTVFTQTPTTAPTPPIEEDSEVVKISTTLVQLDVVVTDKKGKQITDLKPEEFEIYVNGEKQSISNFSYIQPQTTGSNKEKTSDRKKRDKYSVPPPPSKLKLEKIRRTYAIVVDDLGLSFASVPVVRQSLRKFINESMLEGDLVAIVRTGSGIGALQSFTTDKRQLLMAIDKIRWNPQGRGGINFYEPIRQSFRQDLRSVGKQVQSSPDGNDSEQNINNQSVTDATDTEKEFLKEIEQFRNENFSVGTLGGLNYVIRGMRELPGRKAVMFFSEGFPLTTQSRNGFGQPTRIFDLLKRLADVANRSSVVIYTFDPRGLVNPLGLGADEAVTDIFDSSSIRAIDDREARFRDSQQSLRFLAYETGGLPFVNRNIFADAIEEAIEDQSGYYLIGYEPDEETFDPKTSKYNKVEIKVKRENVDVRYRSGFFGVPDKELVVNNNKTPGQQIYGALTSPFGANDISLSLNTVFADDPKVGKFIRSLVFIDGKTLKFEKQSDGIYKADFDILAMTFGDNGTPIDETAKNFTIRAGEKTYRKILEKGVIYNLTVPIKKAGAYQFRVAIRDSITSKVGSASQFIEVPKLKKNRLTLSSIILDNYTVDELKKISNKESNDLGFDVDTALRRFRPGTVLRYDYIIYNAKTNPTNLQVRARLYREGNLLIEGKPSLLDTKGQTDLERIKAIGAVTLGKNLDSGSYVLQIIVTDNRVRKKKRRVATNWIDFEIIK